MTNLSNSVQLIGHLGADPKTHKFDNGNSLIGGLKYYDLGNVDDTNDISGVSLVNAISATFLPIALTSSISITPSLA